MLIEGVLAVLCAQCNSWWGIVDCAHFLTQNQLFWFVFSHLAGGLASFWFIMLYEFKRENTFCGDTASICSFS